MVTYQDVGVQPFINASGTVTTLGGSLMPPEVLEAMREAAGAFVDLNDLNVKAGEYLARRIGVEVAFVSCGAASGVQLSAAACLTGRDVERVGSLPHTGGWKNEFVISMVDTHTYIHQGIEVCGGKLVRVGSKTDVTAEDIVGGIGEKTAAVVHFLGTQSKEQLRAVVAGAEVRGVPVIVDAGVGTASDAAVAMELGADGVLMNTGVAGAKDPVRMARAMRLATEAGWLAANAGRIPKKLYATASSPLDGLID